jgi:LacI family transcriptional regulator
VGAEDREIRPRPDALVAASDLLALGCLHACHELDLAVPGDVALTGFDDIDLAAIVRPRLTTLRQPQERIATECIQKLVARIDGSDRSKPTQLVFRPELIVRDST